MKKSILFIIPGLTGVFDRRWEKRLKLQERDPIFREFFHWAKRLERPPGFANTLMRYFKVSQEAPWAYFGMRGEGLQIKSMDWIKLSIVNDRQQVTFDNSYIFDVAKRFANDFSFAEDAIITSEGNWYMSLGEHRRIRTTTLTSLLDSFNRSDRVDRRNFGIRGNDAEIWIERFREAQRWFRDYNRSESSKLIWPWGTRETMQINGTPKFSAIFSDEAVFRGLGEYLGLSFFKQSYILADLTQMVENHPQMCIFDISLYRALSEDSYQVWERARQHFIDLYLTPIMDSLQDNLIDEIIIDDMLGNVYVYDKKFRIPLRRGSATYYYKD